MVDLIKLFIMYISNKQNLLASSYYEKILEREEILRNLFTKAIEDMR